MDNKEQYLFYKGEIIGSVNVTYDGCIGHIDITEEQLIEMKMELRRLKQEKAFEGE